MKDLAVDWDQAIADAEKLIKHHKWKIKRLKAAIAWFEFMKSQKEPWPGTSETEQYDSAQEHPWGTKAL